MFDIHILDLLGFLCSFLCIALWVISCLFMYRHAMREQQEQMRQWREQSLLLVKNWAEENGFEILRQSPTGFGRFPLRSRIQLAYEVDIRDREERFRTGWVICGGFFLGMRTPKIDVVWSEPTPPAAAPPVVNPMWDRDLDG